MIQKKFETARRKIIEECGCQTSCLKCAPTLKLLDQMAKANLPVAYWALKMSDFDGAPEIKKAVEDYCAHLDDRYSAGQNLCFSGTLGTGKTYSMVNILKQALVKNYSAYYTTLGEMANYLTSYETKLIYGDLVLNCDFLAIDEVDSRHIASSEAAQDFFGANFERVIRHRIQNQLPILLATNNANLEEAFQGQFRKTVESLMHHNTIVVAALGKDFRRSK